MRKEFRKQVLLMLTGLLLFSQPKKMKAEDETAITKQIWLFWDMGTSIEAWALVTGSI